MLIKTVSPTFWTNSYTGIPNLRNTDTLGHQLYSWYMRSFFIQYCSSCLQYSAGTPYHWHCPGPKLMFTDWRNKFSWWHAVLHEATYTYSWTLLTPGIAPTCFSIPLLTLRKGGNFSSCSSCFAHIGPMRSRLEPNLTKWKTLFDKIDIVL